MHSLNAPDVPAEQREPGSVTPQKKRDDRLLQRLLPETAWGDMSCLDSFARRSSVLFCETDLDSRNIFVQ